MSRHKLTIIALMLTGTSIIILCFITYIDMLPLPASLSHKVMMADTIAQPLLIDRNGVPLNTTYATHWNQSDHVLLHEIPELIQKIFILSEDRRFYDHNGIDWSARIHALMQNIMAFRAVRGASTITEQVIRMIHPRKRTIWSRWIEGFEACKLEMSNSKSDILEFYLNQVPYASNRRGVVQASRFYFDRSLETLSPKEILAVATLVRAPSAYDLYNNPDEINRPLERLAQRAISAKLLTETQWIQLKELSFDLKRPDLYVDAPHFVRHVYKNLQAAHFSDRAKPDIRTSLDEMLQNKVQKILATALENLDSHNVANAAVLIAEHGTGEILAWAVGSAFDDQGMQFKSENTRSGTQYIDSVNTPRQPGSAMKPFLYALALEKGWSAAILIDDSPLQEPVGAGIHTYHNYSRIHYGNVTLRNALGNSLNIPAVKTIRFTGVEEYLEKLKLLGITTLGRHPDFYGDGLALGNGEVSLYDMVQAYSVLANSGRFIPLTPFCDFKGENFYDSSIAVFSEEAASIIGNILSDPGSRQLEFGEGDILNFPVQTAVKTGTSSDYKDAWAMGYNSRYTAGVWMGNLDGSATIELTGSRGPAIVLRSLFAELNRMKGTDEHMPLYMSPRLTQKDICLAHIKERHCEHIKEKPCIAEKSQCAIKTEWFVSERASKIHISKSCDMHAYCDMDGSTSSISMSMDPEQHNSVSDTKKNCDTYKSGNHKDFKNIKNKPAFYFINPVNGLEVAMDPRIPDELEYMEFKVTGIPPDMRLKWMVNGQEVLDKNGFKRSKPENRNHSLSEQEKQENSRISRFKSNHALEWKIQRGYHMVSAELIDVAGTVNSKESVSFMVK
ncbi:MAG: transglycosylase domain-containing protein [Desulfamplus sp.]|nr:transglycosylase domain-containing protein [Desulfamplus sp.]